MRVEVERPKAWRRRAFVILALAIAATLAVAAWWVRSIPWRNRCDEPVPTFTSEAPTNAAVSTSQPLATAAAANVLRAGGNAVDAAIAAAFMLSVAEPAHSGLGGGGFALVHDPRDPSRGGGIEVALDFRERAPRALDVAALRSALQRNSNALRDGALAVAVPSMWSGLVDLHTRFGSISLSTLAEPAIAVARAGTVIGRDHGAACWLRIGALRADPEARRIFLTSAGLCPLPGSTLRQPELADTLAALTDATHPRTYDDVIGRELVDFLAARGSPITNADLAAAVAVERPVVEGRFRGKRIVSVGPPSSGGATVIALLQTYEQTRARLHEESWLRAWIEASRLAFHDRATLFGDPDFVDVPVSELLSTSYASAQSQRVPLAGRVELPQGIAAKSEGTNTTHVSVVDQRGMAVALTLSINTPFGAGLVVPGTGVLLNDEMGDFFVDPAEDAANNAPNGAALVGTARNAPAGGKRPLSSMSPTFVFDAPVAGDEAGALAIVLGAPGGPAIPSAVAWVIRGVVEGGLDGESAVRAARIHHQGVPDALQVEPAFDRATLPSEFAGDAERALLPVGRVQMVLRDAHGWRAISDCRDDGSPWEGALSTVETER